MDTARQKSGEGAAVRRKFYLSLLELLILAAIGAILLALMFPTLPHTDRLGPDGITRRKMRRLKWLMLSYESEKHHWPDADKWTSELDAYLGKSEHWDLKSWTNDAWNHPILFELRTNNDDIKASFRSFGRNGVDDHSEPDDIVIEVRDAHMTRNPHSRPAP